MKTPEQIADEALSRSFDPTKSWQDIVIAAIEADRAQRHDDMANQLRALNPKTTGMDWDEIPVWLNEQKESGAKRIAARLLLSRAIKEPAKDPRYWLLVNAAMDGFDERDAL